MYCHLCKSPSALLSGIVFEPPGEESGGRSHDHWGDQAESQKDPPAPIESALVEVGDEISVWKLEGGDRRTDSQFVGALTCLYSTTFEASTDFLLMPRSQPPVLR